MLVPIFKPCQISLLLFAIIKYGKTYLENYNSPVGLYISRKYLQMYQLRKVLAVLFL